MYFRIYSLVSILQEACQQFAFAERGLCLKVEKCLEIAQNPTSQVHAVLGA